MPKTLSLPVILLPVRQEQEAQQDSVHQQQCLLRLSPVPRCSSAPLIPSRHPLGGRPPRAAGLLKKARGEVKEIRRFRTSSPLSNSWSFTRVHPYRPVPVPPQRQRRRAVWRGDGRRWHLSWLHSLCSAAARRAVVATSSSVRSHRSGDCSSGFRQKPKDLKAFWPIYPPLRTVLKGGYH